MASAISNNSITEYQGFGLYEKTGAGTVTLTATTPLVTPWTIYEGVLSTSQDGNLGALTGALTIDGGIWQVTGTAFTTTTRPIVLADTNPRPNGIDIADPSNIFKYDLAVSGNGGLQKLGLGTLALNGISSYSGQTDVVQGALVVGDSPANFMAKLAGKTVVAPGATLAGHGSVGGDIENHGIVAPGNHDLGTLTTLGNYFGSGVLVIGLDGQPGPGVISDHLVVSGTANLTGTTLRLEKTIDEMSCGDQTRVIIAGAYNGQVDLFDISAFNKLMLFDNGTGWVYGVNVLQGQDLSFLPRLNANQQAVARALSGDVLTPANFIDQTKPLDQAVLAVISDCALKGQRLDLLSPESYAGFIDYGIQVTRNYIRTVMGAPTPQVALHAATPTGDTSAFGAFSHYDGKSSSSNNGADYGITSNGGVAGVRHSINNFTAGGFVAIDDGRISSAFVNAEASGWVLGGFVSYLANTQQNLSVDGGVTYGSYQFDGTRNSLSGLASFDGGDTAVFDLFASVQGDAYNKGKLRLTPLLSLHYLQANADAITETGTGTALAVGAMNEDALLAEVALNAQYQVTANFGLLGSLGYTHNFIDPSHQVNAGFIYGHTPFSVISPGMGEDIFSLGVGAIWNLAAAWSLTANYRAEFSSDTAPSNALGVSLSYSF